MFKTRAETRAFFDALIPEIQNVEHCNIVVAPPFTALSTAVDETDGTRVAISAQDVPIRSLATLSAVSISGRPTKPSKRRRLPQWAVDWKQSYVWEKHSRNEIPEAPLMRCADRFAKAWAG